MLRCSGWGPGSLAAAPWLKHTNLFHHCFSPCPVVCLTHGITGDMTLLPELVPRMGLFCYHITHTPRVSHIRSGAWQPRSKLTCSGSSATLLQDTQNPMAGPLNMSRSELWVSAFKPTLELAAWVSQQACGCHSQV